MQRLGLSHAEYVEYVRTLESTHERKIQLTLMDLDGKGRRTLEPLLLSGQVTVDAFANPTRVLTIEFLDPSRSITFDGDDGSGSPVHRAVMIEVVDSRKVPTLGWVDCTVFTGPVDDFDRDGAVVSITAHGKESQASGARWRPRGWPKKFPKHKIIRRLLADTGETRFSIPQLRATTPTRFTVMRLDEPWKSAKKLARSVNRQLFYDGRGVATLRRVPKRPVFAFTLPMVLSPVSRTRTNDGIKNTFLVEGAKPKGANKRVRKVLYLARAHPNSGKSLSRNGENLRLVEYEENDQFKTRRACERRAQDMRDDSLRESVEYSVDTLPVPHLDERDPVRVRSVDGVFVVRMNRWTLPLTGEAMTIGAIRRAGAKGGRRSTGRREVVARG